MLADGGTAYVSTPNVLTLAPPGAAKSDNPWHLREYRAEEFRALCASAFDDVELRQALPRAQAALTSSRCAQAGTGSTPPSASQDRFTTASRRSRRDFALRSGLLEQALDFVAVFGEAGLEGALAPAPELPEAARPSWPPWYGPLALLASIGAIVVAGIPLLGDPRSRPRRTSPESRS